MKAQFNSLNKSNQSIKLSISILEKLSNKAKYQSYSYNNDEIFKYIISIKDSKILISIFTKLNLDIIFNYKIIGSFIYNISNKYTASQVDINSYNKFILDNIKSYKI